ncbi:TMEM175 family protein [Microbacterium sp. X-17]|uniref:TMEM175 family protein n=1 Tax=Microbacterium sp. X-17 TaxID=3144404 RepID=UPI0031F4FB48
MSQTPRGMSEVLSAERLKMFVDAVVAIAMTLLILPLMDSVGEAATHDLSTGDWIVEERQSLFAFTLSFVLIANFWLSHHRLFRRIEHATGALVWLTFAWMFTIVWLPVATAVLSSLATDDLQALVYIGSLSVTSLLTLATVIYVIRHPELHEIDPQRLRETLAADIAVLTLFLVALALTLAVPVLSYWTMFLLLLSPFLGRLVARILRGRSGLS